MLFWIVYGKVEYLLKYLWKEVLIFSCLRKTVTYPPPKKKEKKKDDQGK